MRKHEIGKISLRNVVISFLGVDAHRPHSGGTWVKIGPTEVRELIRLNIFRLEGRGVWDYVMEQEEELKKTFRCKCVHGTGMGILDDCLLVAKLRSLRK